MPYDLAAAEELNNKRVIVTRNLRVANEKGEMAEEIEGQLVAAADMGIMLRPRGNQQPVLIESGEIEDIVAVATGRKEITQKLLKAINLDDARSHLADRHAFPLATVNAMGAAEAMSAHDAIDHSNLGHAHRD